MKRRVMASLRWETPSKRDTFKNDLSAKLGGISCYDKKVRHGKDMEGNPRSTVDCRPENAPDADNLFTFIKDKMDSIPVLTGRVTWHNCKHDEGSPFEPCVIQGEYSV